MSLLLSILKAPDSIALMESSKTIDEDGATLGRGRDNDWVLDDPERFLSSTHCKFTFENGRFYITDLSTNGTFFNGSPDPMGKGNKLPVNDQDSFIIGDYEFSIKDMGASASLLGGGEIPPSPFDSELPDSAAEFPSSPFASGHVSSSDSLFSSGSVETDPLAALDKARGGEQAAPGLDDPFASTADPFAMPTQGDNADPLNQQIDWPETVPEQGLPGAGAPSQGFAGGGVIPDDWDDDLLGSSTPQPPAPTPEPAMPLTEAPRHPQPSVSAPAPGDFAHASIDQEAALIQQELEQANAKIQAELEMLKQQVASQQPIAAPRTSGSIDSTMVHAMGLDNRNLNDAEIARINQLGGQVLREMVRGLMQVLGSRSSIKNEFRMNVTTIQPKENNPLKFSATVDDALENMFIKQGTAYKQAVEAVQEGFEGVAEHQIAVLAGIREAFRSLIERFDPVILEERFLKQQKGSLMIGSQKARNWEAYIEYYNELVGDIDQSFQYLFGDGFVRAYEDQLQKLAISRKSKKHSTGK
jgi:type VI secretion system FHA domain protein